MSKANLSDEAEEETEKFDQIPQVTVTVNGGMSTIPMGILFL